MSEHSDIAIIGGGVIGLAIALELHQRGLSVTVLSRDVHQAASRAAAGMLAPQAENLMPGAMLDLCQKSLALYPQWVSMVERLSQQSAGYWPCGILSPVFERDRPMESVVPDHATNRIWLDQTALHYAQPGLSPEVIGGWWYPEDGQVDNRSLLTALRTAAQSVGVDLREGVTVTGVVQQHGHVVSLQTSIGDVQAGHYILAAGAWSPDLLPVPVFPRKGQMVAVKVPAAHPTPLPLQRVLYGEEIYIVPRQDGRIVLGATVETVGFTPDNTPAGLNSLLQAAMRLYPTLAEFPIHECWWGFRPGTPDELPILGASPFSNLTLATGHYRNGVLLAPVTARLIGDWVCQPQPSELLSAFSWERFLKPASTAVSNSGLISVPVVSHAVPTVQTLDARSVSSLDSAQVDTPLVIAGRSFHSRLMTGTGKYRSISDMQESVLASGCEIVTVAVRRVQTNAPGHEGLAEALDWSKIWMLPNTAGCQNAEEAIRVARLGREMAKLLGQEDNNFVKLEVIPDSKYLLPDPIGTLEAAEQLVKEGFAVLPYINADPLLAKRLEEAGCATVMPLGSPIGSGQGIRNTANIQIIIENAKIPVVVDAGIGTPSEAAQAMEMGADALLINTAIAQAENAAMMARAMGMAAIAGRLAYLAGRIPVKAYASASSPLTGKITE